MDRRNKGIYCQYFQLQRGGGQYEPRGVLCVEGGDFHADQAVCGSPGRGRDPKKIDIPMVFFGANGRVTANGKELASKWYPEAAVNSPYKESYPYEHGGHVFFDVFPEEFNRDLLHFVNALDK